MIASASWPLTKITLEELRQHILDALPNATKATGPVEIFAKYNDGPDQRMTASFETDDPDQPLVVAKICFFPLLVNTAIAHEVVSKSSRGFAPKVLANIALEGGSLLVLAAFDGKLVSSLGRQPVLESARALARVQVSVSAAHKKSPGLKETKLSDFPGLLSDCLAAMRENEAAWTTDEKGKFKQALGFPAAKAIETLEAFTEMVPVWIKQLEAAKVPNSIEHGDCHADNAIRQANGNIMIFDWENATWSHPFFSAEMLMTSAWALDEGAEGGPWGYIRDTATQDLLADAYLGLFEGDKAVLRTAFNSAMCLAIIKEMHHEIQWARACDWKDLNAEWTAQLIRRLVEHSSRAPK